MTLALYRVVFIDPEIAMTAIEAVDATSEIDAISQVEEMYGPIQIIMVRRGRMVAQVEGEAA